MDPVDQYFHEERSFIARCHDVPSLLDRMADYRDEERTAAAKGQTKVRLRLTDLQELVENRVAILKAHALRPRESRRGDTVPAPQQKHDIPARVQSTRKETERRDEHPPLQVRRRAPLPAEVDRHQRQQSQPARAPAARQRVEKARRGAAQRAAAIEKERAELRRLRTELEDAQSARRQAEQDRLTAEERANALERAELERLAKEQRRLARQEQATAAATAEAQAPKPPTVPQTGAVSPREGRAYPPSASRAHAAKPARPTPHRGTDAAPKPAPTTTRETTVPAPRAPAPSPNSPPRPTTKVPPKRSEAETAAVKSGRSSPPRAHPSAASGNAPQKPSKATLLTGADLARFRAERKLSQRAAAQLLGVAHGTIAKGEKDPKKALGAALQAGLGTALREEAPCSA